MGQRQSHTAARTYIKESGGKMQVKEENAIDNQYIFRYKDGSISEVITYRKYLISEIMKDAAARENHAIPEFSTESVSLSKLKKFIGYAKAAGYTIYKVRKL